MLLAWGWEIPFVHLARYAIDRGHADSIPADISLFIGIGGTLGRISVSACADYVGARRMVLALMLIMAAANALLPLFIGSLSFLLGFSFVAGTVSGGIIALQTSLSGFAVSAGTAGRGNTARKNAVLAVASGLVFSMLAPGLIVGPIVAGAAYDATEEYAGAFWAAAGCWVMAAVALGPVVVA
jgi:predicted MFS family arabinose efflux permease